MSKQNRPKLFVRVPSSSTARRVAVGPPAPQPSPKQQAMIYADEVANRIARLETHAIKLAQRYGLPALFSIDPSETITLVPGNWVEHAKLGLGEVVTIEGDGESAKVTVRFFDEHLGTRRFRRPQLRYISNAETDTELAPEDVELENSVEGGSSPSQLVTMAAVRISKSLVDALDQKLHEREMVTLERRDGQWGLFYHRQGSAWGTNTARTTQVPLRDASLDVRQRFLSRSEQFFSAYLKSCDERVERMKAAINQADHTLAMLEALDLD